MISALIIDDDPLLRALIVRFLKDMQEIQVIGSAENATSGLSLIAQHHPDLVILDIQLPDGNAHTLVNQAKQISPSTKVYLCSAYPDERIRMAVDEAGADGFVSKTQLKEGLASIVHSLHAS